MAGRLLTPVTPGNSAITTSPAFNILSFSSEAFRSILQRVNRKIPYVLLAPLVAVVNDSLGRDVVEDHRRKLQPLGERQRLDHFTVNGFSSQLRHLYPPHFRGDFVLTSFALHVLHSVR